MKKLFVFALVLIAVPAFGQQTLTYSWEDGGTVLSTFGNLVGAANVSGPQTGSQGSTLPDYTCPGAYDGDRYLHVAEDPHSGTPYAGIAHVTGLVNGDMVTATFYGYDITAGGSPSLRIWGHYTDGVDPNSYLGSASGPGNEGYTAGTGWDTSTFTWTFNDDDGTGLLVEARLYSTPSTNDPDHTDYWIDYVTVTAPTSATIIFPSGPISVQDDTWGSIKALYR